MKRFFNSALFSLRINVGLNKIFDSNCDIYPSTHPSNGCPSHKKQLWCPKLMIIVLHHANFLTILLLKLKYYSILFMLLLGINKLCLKLRIQSRQGSPTLPIWGWAVTCAKELKSTFIHDPHKQVAEKNREIKVCEIA